MKTQEPDDKDAKIIAVLKDEARSSVRRIARATGLRPSTVHQRMKGLVERGVIQKFTVKLDPEAMGEKLTVFMLVAGSLGRYIDEHIMSHSCISEIYGITGEYDLLFKLRFKNMKNFNKFLIEFRERYSKDIHKTVTMVQTVKLKDI